MWERKVKAAIEEHIYLTALFYLSLSTAVVVLLTSPHNVVQFNSSYRFYAYKIIAFLTFLYCQNMASTARIDISVFTDTMSFY